MNSYLIQWLSVFFPLGRLVFYLLGVANPAGAFEKTPLKANQFALWPRFLSGFIISLIGLFQALSPKVVHFEVALDNLPSYWQGKELSNYPISI